MSTIIASLNKFLHNSEVRGIITHQRDKRKNKLISSEAIRLLGTNEERKLNLEYPSSEPRGRAQVGVRLDLIE